MFLLFALPPLSVSQLHHRHTSGLPKSKTESLFTKFESLDRSYFLFTLLSVSFFRRLKFFEPLPPHRSRPDQASEEDVSEMVDVHNTNPPELKENRTVKDKQFPEEDESIIK